MRRAIFVLAATLVGCSEDEGNTPPIPTGGTAGTATNVVSDSQSTSVGSSAETTGDTGVDTDPFTTGTGTDTDTDTDTGTTGTGTGTSGTTGGSGAYGPCADVCLQSEICVFSDVDGALSTCATPCTDTSNCPTPPPSNGALVCETVNQDDYCVIQCGGNDDNCPAGMVCDGQYCFHP